MRIGFGFDVHAFDAGDHVVLCGVRIAHVRGLRAHSDGDVALHALCDALLGAAALGDIGVHFPDDDPRYQGISSRELLRRVLVKVHEAGLLVGNVDLTLVAQAPRLAPHVPAMCANLAADLEVDPCRGHVKATTTEGLGFTGRGEGLAAHAVALLVPAP